MSTRTTSLLDDGRIVLEVQRFVGHEIFTSGAARRHPVQQPGASTPGRRTCSAPALTAKDMDDIKTAAQVGADFLAISFPKSASDMYIRRARQLMLAAGEHYAAIAQDRACRGGCCAGNPRASDGLMVARGDLVEVGDAAVPALQKRMIRLARKNSWRPATQMKWNR